MPDFRLVPSQSSVSGVVILDDNTRVVVAEFDSASQAIDDALSKLGPAGGCLYFSSGTFQLERPIEVPDRVTLRGSGAATRLVVSGELGVRIQGSRNAAVRDLTIQAESESPQPATGVLMDGAGHCQVDHVQVIGFARYGLHMRNHAYLCEVSHSTFAGNEEVNVLMQDLQEGEFGDYIPNTLSHLMIFGGGRGIELHKTVVANIVACSCYHSRGSAFYLHEWTNSITLTGCRTFQTSGIAFLAEGANELNLSGNIFCWQTEEGIVMRHCRWGTLTGNEVIDAGSYNPGGPNLTTAMDSVDVPRLYSGIVLDESRGFHIGGNAIFAWDVAPRIKHGIEESANCRKNLIVHNNINFNAEEAVVSAGQGTLVKDNIDEPRNHLLANPKKIIQTFQPEETRRLIATLTGQES